MKRFLLFLILVNVHSAAIACQFDNISFDKGFAGARLDGCTMNSPSDFSLLIQPENRPINPSPWYAFKVKAKFTSNITIRITFEQSFPRYLPKISGDGNDWQDVDFSIVDKQLVFEIEASKQPKWIAAQEMIGNDFYQQWIADLDKATDAAQFTLGKSTQGRRINGLIAENSSQKEWLLLIGRQHPPEVTGALAMLPFVETVLANSKLAKEFRQRFNLLIVPILNPDGVHHGHWRHNINGIDLNRDWINFSQIETRQVNDKIKQLTASGAKMVFGIDFHSTQQDVFYTVPTDYTIAPATFSESWLKGINDSTISTFIVRPKPGTSPGRGVFKQYFADTFNAHAITYEMGDNTQRNMIKHVAQQSAHELMKLMLATPSEAFIYQPKD